MTSVLVWYEYKKNECNHESIWKGERERGNKNEDE
jgi:hypothetical protein